MKVDAIIMDKSKTSAAIRRKTSAGDERPSAKSAGFLGVALLGVIAAVVLVPDCVSLILVLTSKMS